MTETNGYVHMQDNKLFGSVIGSYVFVFESGSYSTVFHSNVIMIAIFCLRLAARNKNKLQAAPLIIVEQGVVAGHQLIFRN